MYESDEEWSVTDAGSARLVIEIAQVGVHQAFSVDFHDGIPPGTWGFLYHYTVKERRQ